MKNNSSHISALILLMILLFAAFSNASALAKVWTGQADWDSGSKYMVDSSSAPGDLKLEGTVYGETATSTNVGGIAYDSFTGSVWITNPDSYSFSRYSAIDGALLNTYTTGSFKPYSIAVDNVTPTPSLWMTGYDSNKLRKYNILNGSLIEELVVGVEFFRNDGMRCHSAFGTQLLYFFPAGGDGGNLFVASYDRFFKINPATSSITLSPTGYEGCGSSLSPCMVQDGMAINTHINAVTYVQSTGRIWVQFNSFGGTNRFCEYSHLRMVEPADLNVVWQAEGIVGSKALTYDSLTNTIWSSNYNRHAEENLLQRFDVNANLLETIYHQAGFCPDQAAFNPDTNSIYCGLGGYDNGPNRLQKFDVYTKTVTDYPISVYMGSISVIDIDPSMDSAWVAGNQQERVLKLQIPDGASYFSGYVPLGTIALTFDSEQQSDFTQLSWNAGRPADTSIKFRIKTANTQAELAGAVWSPYYETTPVSFAGHEDKRWAMVEVLLENFDSNLTPTLSDLSLAYSPTPFCGNGIVDANEQCDGSNLNSYTCQSLGYAGGALSCSGLCTFNTADCTSGKPDIIAENASFSPNPITKGDFTNLTAAIKNQGTADANRFYVSLYLGDANGTPIQTQRIASLQKNTTTSVTFALIQTSSLPTGSAAFTVFADYNNMVDENAEANNQKQASLTVNAPPSGSYADLIIDGIAFSDPDVLEGEKVDLTATIKNQGTAASGGFYTALYKGNATTGAIIGISYVGSLASSASTAVIFSDIGTELLSGQITYTAFADYNNMVDENIFETNNQRTADLFVTSTLPDLIVSSLSSDKTIVLPSERVTFNVEISNTGQRAVASDVNIALYEILPSGSLALKELKTLAKDFNCLQDDAYLMAAFCGRAAGDKNTMRTLAFTVDTTGKNGLLEHVVEADYNNQVEESNENNNERNIALSVGVGPDLYFKRISKPCAIAGNEPINITVEVSNKGTVGSNASSLKIHRIESGNEIVIANAPLPGLSVGASETIPVFIPSGELKGLVDIYFTIDPANAINEIDKANNQASTTILLLGGEICGNAKDDDNDGLIDADDSDCTELCTDTIDNDRDGYVNEGCGEICYDLIDNDLDGLADEGCSGIIAEACGDATDNDMDCMVDEFCPFVLQAPLNSDADCLSDADEILFGTNPEKADTDGDCIDDCQEGRYDHTDPVDVNSNLVVLDVTKRLMLGEKAAIAAKHPTLGVLKNATAKLYWQHKTADMETGSEGIMTYKPMEAAEYKADVVLCKNHITASFTAIGETTMIQSIVNFATSLFGSSITDSPLLLILLIILCGLAAILSYRNSAYFFPYEARSTAEHRKEIAARVLLSIAAFIAPLIVNRFLAINPALMLAIAEILVVFIFGYLKGQEYELMEALQER